MERGMKVSDSPYRAWYDSSSSIHNHEEEEGRTGYGSENRGLSELNTPLETYIS